MKNFLLALDQGTSSSRSIVFDAQGRIRPVRMTFEGVEARPLR